MAFSFCLNDFLILVCSLSACWSKFVVATVSNDITTIIQSYLSDNENMKLRAINNRSYQLWKEKNILKDKEIKYWNQLRCYLANLKLSNGATGAWLISMQDLRFYCGLIRIFRESDLNQIEYNEDRYKMIEKLFYIILSNQNLQTSYVRNQVSIRLYQYLFLPFDHETTIPASLRKTPIITMTRIIKNQRYPIFPIVMDPFIRIYVNDLSRMFIFAANEMNNTQIKYNRYTKFAIMHLSWLTQGIITPVLAKLLWNSVVHVEFIEDYLEFDRLTIHNNIDKNNCIQLIIDNVFGLNGTFCEDKLELFVKKMSFLFDLKTVIALALDSNNFCWSSFTLLINWIIENKLTKLNYVLRILSTDVELDWKFGSLWSKKEYKDFVFRLILEHKTEKPITKNQCCSVM